MIRILSVADSIENTRYSVQRCVNTYSDYNVESMIAVPQFTGEDADEQTDIGEVLDYCFSQEKFDAIFIGMIREASKPLGSIIGKMFRASIYKRVLDATEIEKNYAADVERFNI